MIHRLNISVTCAVSEHLHGQVLEFGCSRGAAEREYTVLHRQVEQPIRSRKAGPAHHSTGSKEEFVQAF